jgi:hypothetical protein
MIRTHLARVLTPGIHCGEHVPKLRYNANSSFSFFFISLSLGLFADDSNQVRTLFMLTACVGQSPALMR